MTLPAMQQRRRTSLACIVSFQRVGACSSAAVRIGPGGSRAGIAFGGPVAIRIPVYRHLANGPADDGIDSLAMQGFFITEHLGGGYSVV